MSDKENGQTGMCGGGGSIQGPEGSGGSGTGAIPNSINAHTLVRLLLWQDRHGDGGSRGPSFLLVC